MLSRFAFALALVALASVPADAQQPNCPNGRCPLVPQRGFPSAPIPGPLTVPQQMPPTKLDATPVGTAPGPDYSWRELPGVGYGWVQDSVAGDPAVAGGPLARLTRKVVCERIRTLAVERAVAKGIPRAEARAKIAKISDEQILGGAIAMGAPVGALGDGTILRWLWEHRDEIVRWILSILSLFGDEDPKVGQLQDASTYSVVAAPVPNHLIPPVVDPIQPGYRWCFQHYELVVLQVEGETVTYRCTSCPEMSWPGVGPGCERNQQTRQRVREEVAAFGVPAEPWDGRLWFDL